MAVYTNTQDYRRNPVDEAGCTFKPISGPTLVRAPGADNWMGIWFYFWSCQIGFRRPNDTSSGGGHFGIVWSGDDHGTGVRTAINCGMYDDMIGGGTTVRGSLPDPRYYAGDRDSYILLDEYGHGGWKYGDTVKMRVYKSPRQNWTAAELQDGGDQPPEYTGVDQVTSGPLGAETAFGCDYKINDGPWIFFRVVLMKDVASTRPIWDQSIFTEAAWETGSSNPIWFPDNSWPYDPECHFRDWVWDGRHVVSPNMILTYATSGPQALGSDQTLVTDGLGKQWVRHACSNGLTRTNPHNTVVTVNPATWWDASPANVTPNPTLDPAARVPTPRPWF